MAALVQEYLERNNSPRTAQGLATALQTADTPCQVAFQQLATIRSQNVANMLIRSAVLRSVHPATRPAERDTADQQCCAHLEDDLDAWAYTPAAKELDTCYCQTLGRAFPGDFQIPARRWRARIPS